MLETVKSAIKALSVPSALQMMDRIWFLVMDNKPSIYKNTNAYGLGEHEKKYVHGRQKNDQVL